MSAGSTVPKFALAARSLIITRLQVFSVGSQAFGAQQSRSSWHGALNSRQQSVWGSSRLAVLQVLPAQHVRLLPTVQFSPNFRHRFFLRRRFFRALVSSASPS